MLAILRVFHNISMLNPAVVLIPISWMWFCQTAVLEKCNSVKYQHILIKSSQPISPIRGILTLILGENCDKTATSEETKINALFCFWILGFNIKRFYLFCLLFFFFVFFLFYNGKIQQCNPRKIVWMIVGFPGHLVIKLKLYTPFCLKETNVPSTKMQFIAPLRRNIYFIKDIQSSLWLKRRLAVLSSLISSNSCLFWASFFPVQVQLISSLYTIVAVNSHQMRRLKLICKT